MTQSVDVTAQLNQIYSIKPEERYTAYEQLIYKQIVANNVSAIQQCIQHLIEREGSDQYGRTYIVPDLLTYIITTIADEQQQLQTPLDIDEMIPLLKYTIELIRTSEYCDALFAACELLGKCYQANNDFYSAAVTLTGYEPDEKCTVSTEQKFAYYITTCEYWLECDDSSGSAAQAIKRAQLLYNECKSNNTLVLRYKIAYARVSDLERKFIDAANRYIELSQVQDTTVTEQDKLQSLQYGIRCAILAKAGPQRTELLAKLYSDTRSKQLVEYTLLEKMYKHRIVRSDELSAFESTLPQHQIAATSTGKSVLQNSIIEHNILAVAQLYHNITYTQLGELLHMTVQQAEQLISSMIDTQRLDAYNDQIQQCVVFHNNTVNLLHSKDDTTPNSKLQNTSTVQHTATQQYNIQIETMCYAVDKIAQNVIQSNNVQQGTAMT